ncbi:MAG TPA: threonine synthase [Bacteroidota bacterium]|nr:threonine synthase [Bacteroidota bacterium]
MKFHSVVGKSPPVDFSTALLQGLAPDGGLYVPEEIPRLPRSIMDRIDPGTLHQLAFQTISRFLPDVPEDALEKIIQKSLTFPIPLVKLEEHLYLLELFHGPTLAFKDVGARFMAEILSYVLAQQQRTVSILVATSGDTGSAVAHGFFGVPQITVYVLYPSGKISRLQEQQMTTLGGNICAIEVDGTFDDCQRLVKQALVDSEVLASRPLTTANSINLARLLPQIVYYVWAFAQYKQMPSASAILPTVVVPSGNFGNLTAAVYAKWMGVPFGSFIAATNANDVVPKYLQTGTFSPRPTLPTLSNAMDVGNPSNLSRLQSLYKNDLAKLRREIDAVSISDEETLREIKRTHDRSGHILDPHTAVGVAAARLHSSSGGNVSSIIVAATAHPAKFGETIRRAIGLEIPLPPSLQEALRRTKRSTRIGSDYEQLKAILIG